MAFLQLSKGVKLTPGSTLHPVPFFLYGLVASTWDLTLNPLVTTSSIDKLNAVRRSDFCRILHNRVTSGCDPGRCIGSERQPTVFCRLKGRSDEIAALEEAANGSCRPAWYFVLSLHIYKIIQKQRDRLIYICVCDKNIHSYGREREW